MSTRGVNGWADSRNERRRGLGPGRGHVRASMVDGVAGEWGRPGRWGGAGEEEGKAGKHPGLKNGL